MQSANTIYYLDLSPILISGDLPSNIDPFFIGYGRFSALTLTVLLGFDFLEDFQKTFSLFCSIFEIFFILSHEKSFMEFFNVTKIMISLTRRHLG